VPRRTNSFARALKDAEKRLVKAQTELARSQQRVMELNAEIPRLQQIIASLSGKGVPSGTDSTGFSNTRNSAVTGGHRAETSAAVPAELAKFVGPQDLTGFGSIPANSGRAVPTKIETEADTLPDPDGEELSE
jgi:hypothetical protein